MVPGEHCRIPVGRKHRFEALDEPVQLTEISTPELNDVVRLEDDYCKGRDSRTLKSPREGSAQSFFSSSSVALIPSSAAGASSGGLGLFSRGQSLLLRLSTASALRPLRPQLQLPLLPLSWLQLLRRRLAWPLQPRAAFAALPLRRSGPSSSRPFPWPWRAF